MKFDLLPNERTILEDKSLTLTNCRLRVYNGQDYSTVLLNKISAIQIKYQEQAYWIAIAALGALYAIGDYIGSSRISPANLIGFAAAILGVIFYLSSRKHSVVIGTDSGITISFATVGLKRESIDKLIFQVESALVEVCQSGVPTKG